MELVSIGRNTVDCKLFDTKGGLVKLYSSLTVEQQSQISTLYGKPEELSKQLDMTLDMIVACFVDWNVGKDGVVLPCTKETLREFTQRDILAMLQACTGRQLLDKDGNLLSEDEISKKGKGA